MTNFALTLSVLALLPKSLDLLDRLLGGITQEKLGTFLSLLENSIDEINKSKTDDAKRLAAIKLVNAIKRFR